VNIGNGCISSIFVGDNDYLMSCYGGIWNGDAVLVIV
jgi:glutamate 5-kinase